MADESKEGVLLKWVRAELVMDFEPPNPSLIVSGELPYPMKVVLEPLPELLIEPEYWPTKVLGYPEGNVHQVVGGFSGMMVTAMGPRGLSWSATIRARTSTSPARADATRRRLDLNPAIMCRCCSSCVTSASAAAGGRCSAR